MKKLTEATCYEDIEKYVKETEWDSKTIASKITWYGKSWGKDDNLPRAKTQCTINLHLAVYNWLVQYKNKHSRGNYFGSRWLAVNMMQHDKMTVAEVYEHFKAKGDYVSKVTLYKFKKRYIK